ncbi:MAG: substrate-binding periplasmic protein [Bdellovibrionales bacterium]
MLRILVALALMLTSSSAMAADKAFERILKNGEINCANYVLGTIFSYDETGKPKGFTVDLMNEVALRTGLKVKYNEIASFATLQMDIEAGKYDMVCTPVLFFPPTFMKFLPSQSITHDEIKIYAAKNFDITHIKNLEDFNNPKYRFVGMDGELGGLYVPRFFPKAKLVMLPLGTSPGQMILELETKKADFILLSRMAGNAVLKENPGKIKMVSDLNMGTPSVRLFYPLQSYQLKANIDAILEEIINEGVMDKLLVKHNLKF